MKSAVQVGLVAALLCPNAVIAGSTCPKAAYGSKRVTCILEVDQTTVRGDDHGHGNKKHKNDLDIIRTTDVYAFSFIWNYFIKDGCPKTEAHLRPILPMLGHTHHTINCRVEARWSPDKDPHGNYSVDYAGHGLVDWKSVPARMEWPFVAHYDRPEQHSSNSEYLNVKYQLAEPIALSTFEVHSGHGDDFSHYWGQQGEGIHLPGYEGYQNDNGHDSHDDDDGKNGGWNNGNGKDKKDKKHHEEEPKTSVKKSHNKFGGHYNTKKLHSCWVFEKYHLGIRQVISEKKKKKGDDHGNDNDDSKGYNGNWFDFFKGSNGNGNNGISGNNGNNGYFDGIGGIGGIIGYNGNDKNDNGKNGNNGHGNELGHSLPGYPFFPHMWSTCEPEFIAPCHEDDCHGDSCGSDHGKNDKNGKDDKNDKSGKNGNHGNNDNKDNGQKKDGGDHCDGNSCGHKNQLAKSCEGQSCGETKHDGCEHESCGDDGSHDGCEDDCGGDEDEKDGDCGEGEDGCGDDGHDGHDEGDDDGCDC